MSENAVANARDEALEHACPHLRRIITDMGYSEIDNVHYIVVQLRMEKKHTKHWLAHVETPIRVDYGEPQPTKKRAKQSAAFAALLYMIRANQFGRNFIEEQRMASVAQENSIAEFNRDMKYKESRLRSVSVSSSNSKEAKIAHEAFEKSLGSLSPRRNSPLKSKIDSGATGGDDGDDGLVAVSLSFDTQSRERLDALVRKYAPPEKKVPSIERSVSLESSTFAQEARQALASAAEKRGSPL